MTSSNIFSKISKKLVWVLVVISMLCFAAFTISCGDDETSYEDPNYTYTDTNDGLISNGSFVYGTSNLTTTSYPKTSVTGWTRSYDTTASQVNSGIVDVSPKGWNATLSTLYKDVEFFSYTTKIEVPSKTPTTYSETLAKNEIIKAKAAEGISNYEPSKEEITQWVIDNYLLEIFNNPSTHPGATDNKVYMLNNYGKAADFGVGTSQKITSSSSISLNKGEYGKYTVWIYTQNLARPIQSNENYGANVRVTSTFNGTTQSEYKITNIVSDNQWTQYTVYVKADDTYNCNVTLALGLGDGKRDVTEGTVYFDDVTFTHLTAEEFAAETASVANLKTSLFAYSQSSTDAIVVNDKTANADAYLYDMTLDTYLQDSGLIGSYVNDVTFDTTTVKHGYTTSNIAGQDGNKDGGKSSASIKTQSGKTYLETTLGGSSYTVTIKDTNAFKVAPESYAYVEFDILNNLSKFGSTTISVDVFDIFGTEIEKRASVVSLSEVSDSWTKCGVLIKNNFIDSERSFYINVVIGPNDVANTVNTADYAKGTVCISKPVIAKGLIETDDTAPEADLYSLYKASANGQTALYAGFTSDYSENEAHEHYALTYSPSDIGIITHSPANSSAYTGIDYNHVYVKGDAGNAGVNTRSGNGQDGSYAGIVNTKYASAYKTKHGFDLSNLLEYTQKENVQPLMIYNKTADSYGFIGRGYSVSVNSNATISVDVRVVGNANAYVYLTDISGTGKNVMTFESFTTNAENNRSSIAKGTEINGENLKMMLKVDSSMMDDNGWVTVTFYVSAGATAKDFRVEVWNGSRDGAEKSQGYVFFNNINVNTTGGFNLPTSAAEAFIQSGNPLYDAGVSAFDKSDLIVYQRELTSVEKQFNKDYADRAISYIPNFVWAKNDTMIYAVYRTIDPVDVDPYENIPAEEETEGCASDTDPSAFWLSFSSILLAAVLLFAIIMLVVKKMIRRRGSKAKVKSHYTVTSRIKSSKKKEKTAKKQTEEVVEEEIEEEVIEEQEEEIEEVEQTEETPVEEQTLDEYVYGEVQDFGDNSEENKD